MAFMSTPSHWWNTKQTMPFMPSLTRALVPCILLAGLGVKSEAADQASPAGDAAQGKVIFQQSCAICHADASGPGGAVVTKQGPSLVGVFGRHAATGSNFTYTKALTDSGFTWDAATLDRFLTNPSTAVPGTTMPIPVAKDQDRLDLIAYLKTLNAPAAAAVAASAPTPAAAPGTDPGDWRLAAPGVKHHITVADLPPLFATHSAGNGPQVVKQPDGATLSVPPGFTIKPFFPPPGSTEHLSNARLLRIAPNGDIFLSEPGAGRVMVFRAADGADTPSEHETFADHLNGPFGIAFYPPGNDPQWVYVANNNSVVRFAYHNGDLKATGAPEVIVPQLTESHGGHSTRDVVFSLDGKRMFISVGSGSNTAESMSKKSPDEVKAWEAVHGKGAAWDAETNRADILVTDPEGKTGLHTFATGIRNGVGLAVQPTTGKLWVSTNERDGLGDDLVPEYVSSVKEGGYYGWPWYYMGNHEDPRHPGERPDLASQAIVPDVLIQAHSASLQLAFYTATSGVAAFPAEYHGDIFVAEHGSWNRTTRTGYKVIRVRLKDGVPTGEYDDFLTGFVVDDRSVWGRPVGVACAHDGALLVTDDGSNTLWRITYTGH
jgi:glucose/arabinose dehydrogenase